LIRGPGRGGAGTRYTFDPLLGSELVFAVAGEEREFGKFRLPKKFDVGVNVGHGVNEVTMRNGGGGEGSAATLYNVEVVKK